MKQSKATRIFNIFNILLMIILCVVMLYPYLNQLAISLNEGTDTMRGGITIFPRKFTWENYLSVFRNARIKDAAVISVTRVIISTLLSLCITYAAAYSLSRKRLNYRRAITLYMMIPSYISAGVIPVYMTLRYYHMINTYFVYFAGGLFTFYNMIIFRSFLQDLPEALEESAKIDGANDLQVMINIFFPLSLPVVATVALWCAVAAWNDWTTTLMYITDKKLYSLQYMMMKLIKEAELAQEMAKEAAMSGKDIVVKTTSDSVKAATLIVTTIPIIMVYPFLQKYFIKGISLGAVKG